MINLRILVVSMFFSTVFYGQIKIPIFKDTTSSKQFPNDTFLTELIKNSEVVITFRRYSAWTLWKEFKVISFQNDKKWHYYYSEHFQDTTRFFEVKVPQASIAQLWECVTKNNLTEIKKEKKYDENCKEMIYDSHYYEFWIVAKDMYRKILYYNPEFFELNCSKDKERRLIINCATKFLRFSEKHK